jgi:hypothetical protein
MWRGAARLASVVSRESSSSCITTEDDSSAIKHASSGKEAAERGHRKMVLDCLNRLKDWIVWSWTYLWAFWFLLVSDIELICLIRRDKIF